MADPVDWFGPVAAKYGPTALGLLIGTTAKYGLSLSEGRKLTWRGALADMLLLGMLGLIAILVSDWFALTGNARVLAGALAAVSSDRLVRLVRDRVMQSAERKLATALDLPPDTSAEITKHPRAPAVVKTRTSPEPADPMRRELRQAWPPPAGHDAAADGLIDKLDQ